MLRGVWSSRVEVGTATQDNSRKSQQATSSGGDDDLNATTTDKGDLDIFTMAEYLPRNKCCPPPPGGSVISNREAGTTSSIAVVQ